MLKWRTAAKQHTHTHTHIHTYIYIYIYIYVCVCVCKQDLALNNLQCLICHKTKPIKILIFEYILSKLLYLPRLGIPVSFTILPIVSDGRDGFMPFPISLTQKRSSVHWIHFLTTIRITLQLRCDPGCNHTDSWLCYKAFRPLWVI